MDASIKLSSNCKYACNISIKHKPFWNYECNVLHSVQSWLAVVLHNIIINKEGRQQQLPNIRKSPTMTHNG
jgi:hypothetical protein